MPLFQSSRDETAIHIDATQEFNSLTEKSVLVAADLALIEDSAAVGAKRKVQIQQLLGAYQYAAAAGATSTTATSYTTTPSTQNKVSLTLPAVTATYRIGFSSILYMASSNQIGWIRLYNETNTATLYEANIRPSNTGQRWSISSFVNLSLTGSSKTIRVQFRSDGGTETFCSYTTLEAWRVI